MDLRSCLLPRDKGRGKRQDLTHVFPLSRLARGAGGAYHAPPSDGSVSPTTAACAVAFPILYPFIWRTSMLPTMRTWGLVAMALALTLTMPAHAQSEADCSARADRAARDAGTAVGGGGRGAVGGAVVGAIASDDSREGARRGAAAGAVVGAATGAVRNNQSWKSVFDDCMAGR